MYFHQDPISPLPVRLPLMFSQSYQVPSVSLPVLVGRVGFTTEFARMHSLELRHADFREYMHTRPTRKCTAHHKVKGRTKARMSVFVKEAARRMGPFLYTLLSHFLLYYICYLSLFIFVILFAIYLV